MAFLRAFERALKDLLKAFQRLLKLFKKPSWKGQSIEKGLQTLVKRALKRGGDDANHGRLLKGKRAGMDKGRWEEGEQRGEIFSEEAILEGL